MSQTTTRQHRPLGHKVKQRRSQKTYDALIAAGFRLLEDRELDAISVAELAASAGYSVGAFYARFRSKDEFFDAMIDQHLQTRRETQRRLLDELPNDGIVAGLIENVVGYYWSRRRFWRAALMRSMRDPAFWTPIRQHGNDFASAFVLRVNERVGRVLTADEETNIRFAFQLVFGTINNTIINRPGPVFMGQSQFIDSLVRAFRLVSNYDNLKATRKSTRRARTRHK